jgi:hypothetical protein
MKVGVSTVIVFVILINEVYKRRIASNMKKIMKNNLVDIRWVSSSYSSVEGNPDRNILSVDMYPFNFENR